MRRLLQKYKYPLMILALMSTSLALTHLYWRIGLTPPFSLSLALFVSAILSDYGTTVVASRLGGKEGNPFVNTIFKKMSVEKGGLIVMGVFALAIIFIFTKMPPYQQLAVACTYWLIPINNAVVIRRLWPKAEA